MEKSRAIITTVLLLSLLELHSANAEITTLKHSYSYPQKEVKYSEYAFKDGSLVYAVCDEFKIDRIVDDNKIMGRNCTVIQRLFPYDKVTRSCNVTLRTINPNNNQLTNSIYVHAFGQENAILFLSEMGSRYPAFDLMAIRFTDCEIRYVFLDDDSSHSMLRSQIYFHRLVTYENEFDLFYNTEKEAPWSSKANGMRVSFDHPTKTNIFDIIKDSDTELVTFISPIATRSPTKGFIYATTGKVPYILWMVRPNGTKKLLTSHQEYHHYLISAVYDVITSCVESVNGTKTTCTQYDEDGDIKFNITLDLANKKGIIVHNTPEGGLLLMTASLEKITSYDVIKVDSSGRKVGTFRLNDFAEEYGIIRTPVIWENDDKYCAALSEKYSDHKLNVVVSCFTDDDLLL